MKTRILLAGLTASLFITGFTSCKKCDVPDDVSKGMITAVPDYEDVVIYINGLADSDGQHITGSSQTAIDGLIEVSFDGGLTKQPFPWGGYDLLLNPMTVDCEASFERNVFDGPFANMVTYSVIATTCTECENGRTVLNEVMVPKIASGTTVTFEQDIKPQ